MTKKVFLGVGHGGIDSGALKGDVYEKDLNLAIALACNDYLLARGVSVLMSRYIDEDDTLTEEILEANAFDPDVAIDIHNNAGGGDGFEVYYEVVGGVSRQLAQDIETEVLAIGQNSRGLKTKLNSYGEDWFGFVREVKAPSILVECAFVDNDEDMKIIDTEEKQVIMGQAIAKGILTTLCVEDIEQEPIAPPVVQPPYKIEWFSFVDDAMAIGLMESLNLLGINAELTMTEDKKYKVTSHNYPFRTNAESIGEGIKKLKGYFYNVLMA